MREATKFHCPNCEAEYKVVRIEAAPTREERPLTCLCCGAPLRNREGNFALFADVQSRQRMSELARVNRLSTAGELTASIARDQPAAWRYSGERRDDGTDTQISFAGHR